MQSGHGGSFEGVTASTFHLYTCPEFVIRGAPREQPRPLFVFTLRGGPCATVGGAATVITTQKCKDGKWTRLLLRSASNHKHGASVKMKTGHGGSFEGGTASTFHLYTGLVFVITGAPREPARPLFIFTLRGGPRVTGKLHARAVRSHLESSLRAPPRP